MSIPSSRIKLTKFVLCARGVETHRPFVDATPLSPKGSSATGKSADSLPSSVQSLISEILADSAPQGHTAHPQVLAYRYWLGQNIRSSTPAWSLLDNLSLERPYDRDLSAIEYRSLIDRLELNDYVASVERCLGVRL